MINFEGVKNERAIRTLIKRNLNKEIHPATKPSIDFIYKILDDAYNSGINYDITDMRGAIIAFAANSTNQSNYCIKLVNDMKFRSEEISENINNDDKPIIFYDVEVFPNLLLINWKFQGEGKPVVRMINPKPSEIETLLKYRLVGFNVRKYDNHILYARLIGYSNEQIYRLSQRLVSDDKNNDAFFGEAYNISYTDVYDFAAKKQSLKKWEIELGISHKELGLPWDKPVPEEQWIKVAEYCDNDVLATEAVFNHLKGDWTARQILADLAGASVNDTTNTLTTKIVFGTERHPKLVYTDLATGEPDDPEYKRSDIITAFPGYEYINGKNMYRDVDLGYGGYVYAEPGIYTDVALLDIASLHPNSIRAMNCFGKYTKNFTDILDARISIKHGDYESVRHMFNGRLAPYLNDESTAKDLAQALKIAINSVYGMSSASYDNPFRDVRNVNNIVALRGALFMKTLQDEVQKRGFTVVHIKTDSIKIANATQDIIDFCMDFANKYGYTFEHEATYDRMCLVNDAVYIAKYKDGKHANEWTATGTQFQIPYVFKTVFSKEPITFEDMCETKSVKKGALYLDMNEKLPDVSNLEKEYNKKSHLLLNEQVVKLFNNGDSIEQISKKINQPIELVNELYNSIDHSEIYEQELFNKCNELRKIKKQIDECHNYIFVGRVGRFCPMKPGYNGGILVVNRNDKYVSATGSKGYRWLESEMVKELNKIDGIDKTYYNNLVDDAIETISKYGDFELFISD